MKPREEKIEDFSF